MMSRRKDIVPNNLWLLSIVIRCISCVGWNEDNCANNEPRRQR